MDIAGALGLDIGEVGIAVGGQNRPAGGDGTVLIGYSGAIGHLQELPALEKYPVSYTHLDVYKRQALCIRACH